MQVSLTDDTSIPACDPDLANVSITVVDLSPMFNSTEYPAEIQEGASVGTPVIKVIINRKISRI